MTPAPVEIARKVLEAGKKVEDAGQPYTADLFHMGIIGGDRAEYIAVAANGAEALARAVIELSAENERLHGLIDAAHALSECACICPRHNGVRRILRGADATALAALSPTEGDGRKANNG